MDNYIMNPAQETTSETACHNAESPADVLPLHACTQELEREYARTRRYGHSLAFVVCDIDRLKLIDQGFGHEAGDETLRAFVARARRGLRACDWITRTGDDEFTIILPETDLAGAAIVGERIRKLLAERPICASTGTFTATVSVGYAAANPRPKSPAGSWEALLATAREQVELAVRRGRNRVCGHPLDGDRSRERPQSESKQLTTVPAPDRLMVMEYGGLPSRPSGKNRLSADDEGTVLDLARK